MPKHEKLLKHYVAFVIALSVLIYGYCWSPVDGDLQHALDHLSTKEKKVDWNTAAHHLKHFPEIVSYLPSYETPAQEAARLFIADSLEKDSGLKSAVVELMDYIKRSRGFIQYRVVAGLRFQQMSKKEISSLTTVDLMAGCSSLLVEYFEQFPKAKVPGNDVILAMTGTVSRLRPYAVKIQNLVAEWARPQQHDRFRNVFIGVSICALAYMCIFVPAIRASVQAHAPDVLKEMLKSLWKK